jgi:hypothetical protein
MTHLKQTCALMAATHVIIDRLSHERRDMLRRGLEHHAKLCGEIIEANQDILRGLGIRLRCHPAANDATILPGAA